MERNLTLGVATGVAVLLAAAPAAAQARALLREGDPLAGAPGHTVSSISNTAVNQVGGFAATINSSDGVTTLSHTWGTATGASPGILRTETTVGMFEQTSFESFFGIDDAGQSAYSPICNDLVGGGVSLDGVWIDGTVIAIEDDPILSLPGKVWRFGSRPGITANGTLAWVGGIDDGTSGANEGNGLFMGAGATVLVKSGDVIPGLPAAVSSSGVDFDFRVSALGTHWIAGVDTDATSTADFFILIDGAPLSIAGNLVGEGQPVDASSGGLPGELWDNFDFLGIAETGSYMFTGDTDAAMDEFIAVDGVIRYREGDVVDGQTLDGALEGAYMNEAGQVAYIWDVTAAGGTEEALFFEDHLLMREGQTVDISGDGIVDSGATLANFTGITALTMGPDATMYFTADVDVVGGGTIEVLYCLPYECLSADTYGVSVAAGGAQTFSLDAGPAAAANGYFLVGSMSGTSPGFLFQGMTVPLNPDPYFNLTVNNPNTPMFMSTLGLLDVDGRGTAALVIPPGASPSLIGLSAHHAFAVFTVAPITVSKVSGAVSFVALP